MDTVKVGDLSIAYRAAGDASKPALVLLHGWPHSSVIYGGVMDKLAQDAYVLAFDLPGIGDSRGRPASAAKRELADVLITAAELLGAKSIGLMWAA
jgi:pimeloyl-ACP methyl ester carboxylesterase